MEKVIIAEMKPDWLEPYRTMGQDIPVVVARLNASPKYMPRTRLDWGMISCALRDGYEIRIRPRKK
jgi:hypothetical protein